VLTFDGELIHSVWRLGRIVLDLSVAVEREVVASRDRPTLPQPAEADISGPQGKSEDQPHAKLA
jgi:hypothetical protein